MLLAIDIGNTNIVIALFQGDALLSSWRIYTDCRRTGDEYGSIIQSLFRHSNISYSGISYSIISSVVPALIAPFMGMVEAVTGKKPILVSPQIFPLLPVFVPKEAVHEVGSDLVCNAVEAFCRFGQAAIVADFGTALSFTAVGNTGHIMGVAIAPGLGTAVNSLFQGTAQLPAVALEAPPSALGRNTIHSIQAGVVLGYKGLVEQLVGQMRTEVAQKCGVQEDAVTVVATGGLNSVLNPITSIFQLFDKQFTLRGLKRIADIVYAAG